jgi:membrane dipeptidase
MPASQNLPIFDGHNDALLRYEREPGYDFLKRNETGHLDLPRALEGGFAGGFFAVFVPSPRPPGEPRPKMTDYATPDGGFAVPIPEPIQLEYAQHIAFKLSARLFQIEQAADGRFKVVRTADELAACLESGVIAAILHFEGAEAIDPDLDALEVYYQAGLRSLGLVWSRPTAFGYGVPFRFPHSPDVGDGLTAAGKELVKACNRLGILVDLSHLNEKGFWDVAALSDAPLVATHSNVHALSPVSRNLTDKQLDAIRDSDGMVGLNFAVSFLRADAQSDTSTPLETMVRHIDYLIERVGEDRVAFGSDFDGTTVPAGITDAAGLPHLVNALRSAGYDDATLEKLAYRNWLRLLRLTWK